MPAGMGTRWFNGDGAPVGIVKMSWR
jgi:hypothetical protein